MKALCPYLGEHKFQPRGTLCPALGTLSGAASHGGCGPTALLAPELCLSPCQLPWMGSGEVTVVPTPCRSRCPSTTMCEGTSAACTIKSLWASCSASLPRCVPPTSTLLPTYPACPVPLLVPVPLLLAATPMSPGKKSYVVQCPYVPRNILHCSPKSMHSGW